VSGQPGQVQNALTSLLRIRRPEFLQPVQTILRLIAGDQAGVDAPIDVPMIQSGSDGSLVHGLIDPGLIGAERAAALEDQDGLALLLRRLLRARDMLHSARESTAYP